MTTPRHGFALVLVLAAFGILLSARGQELTGKTLQEEFPGLTSGSLSHARLVELPQDLLLKAGEVEVTRTELDSALAEADAGISEQLARNKLFLLENVATSKLLLAAARAAGGTDQSADVSEKEVIQKYFERFVSDIEITEEEVAQFYEENKDMCGGASLEQIKDQLKDYVLGQKKQDAVTEHIRTIGRRTPIGLAVGWVQEQAKLALDNPVDKARVGGKPSLVDFGSTGCRPCDMMAPILEKLETKYKDKLNVLFVHVRKEQILASRYGIQSIPVQIFFNKDGKEVYRHTGFYPQDEIEKRLKEIGIE